MPINRKTIENLDEKVTACFSGKDKRFLVVSKLGHHCIIDEQACTGQKYDAKNKIYTCKKHCREKRKPRSRITRRIYGQLDSGVKKY